ncbi:hypothetical protein HN018_24760 (plasmid) [Lichenicola cladoniae]|uniref:Uncharacterized protein n=1 Tax=Lichenicola cladoniae TaxID=1484109 RepID=A0A6M8HZ32_9PROT|nr:hypothetical protein [Lichenicola cladoniae]NPD70051.1 hypothetical protein [Acetobacteraceae bacterium]QKE93405.1 hypothetical protein HN018_24760 [Lichenicola cladoniae]
MKTSRATKTPLILQSVTWMHGLAVRVWINWVVKVSPSPVYISEREEMAFLVGFDAAIKTSGNADQLIFAYPADLHCALQSGMVAGSRAARAV